MTKKYKNEGLMKILVILGAVVGLVTLILGLPIINIPNYAYVDAVFALHYVVNFIIGLVIVILTFWVGLRPNNPIPFHWLVLIIFAILLVLFGAGIWSCILVLIAGIIGIIEEL
ncbi:MAG: hypothetical protein JSV23_00640 [Promethearchaeota archaeon]|nr:MAG: hypothetical protein JSV23_00640 [Candidatus Lokiarchaeota archaeon]